MGSWFITLRLVGTHETMNFVLRDEPFNFYGAVARLSNFFLVKVYFQPCCLQ